MKGDEFVQRDIDAMTAEDRDRSLEDELAILQSEEFQEEQIIERLTRMLRVQVKLYLAIVRDRRLGRLIVIGVTSVLIVLTLLVAGIAAVLATVNGTVDQQTTDRAAARISRCEADNNFARNHNKLVFADARTFEDILVSPSISDQTRAFAEDRKADLLSTLVPERDCSPSAVDRYYADIEAGRTPDPGTVPDPSTTTTR